MRVVFAHDHIFKQDTEGNYYTAGSFNNDVWNRYLNHFDEITVIARLDKNKIDVENTYNKFNLTKAHFTPVPSLSGPVSQFKNKTTVYQTIKKELECSDALVARLPSETGNMSIKVAKDLGKPYIVEVVACVWDALWNYGNIQAKLYAPIAMMKMKNNVKNSPYVVYVTSEFLQERYPCNGETINISNVEIANVSKQSLEMRLTRYSSNQKLFTIGMIGSLDNKIKGLEIAFKALEILNNENVDFQFQILGDGDQTPWKSMAREMNIEDKVKFCGVLPGGEPVLNWLDNIDVYIQPSYQEGLPRAVIEAMSRGCPIIGSAAGGIPELINPNCIHKTGDYESLSNLLQKMMFDTLSISSLAKQNINEAEKYTKNILDTKRQNFLNHFNSIL